MRNNVSDNHTDYLVIDAPHESYERNLLVSLKVGQASSVGYRAAVRYVDYHFYALLSFGRSTYSTFSI